MSAIDTYLTELDAALTVRPRSLRRRILAEAEDHLRCAAEASDEQTAIGAFGAPDVVARRFAEELAHGGASRAAWAGAAVTVLFAALVALGPPGDAIPWVAVQVALTCAALSALRVWRHRRDDAVPAGKLRYVNRGVAVALAAVLVACVCSALASIQAPGAAVVGLAALAALVALGRAQRRVRALAVIDNAPAEQDAFDDLVAAGGELLGRVAPARGEGLAARATTAAERLAGWSRAHPWGLCLVVASLAGGALAAAHAVAEPPPDVPTGLLVAAILVALEGGAVVVCFALLGRFLGIRGGP